MQLGYPVFIIQAAVLPNAALGAAMALGSLMLLNYVHIMTRDVSLKSRVSAI